MIGVCFRLLGTARNSDSVVSTAAATVRQVVALVFQHVSTGSTSSHGAPGASAESLDDSSSLRSPAGAESPLLLLDDLCSMATGEVHACESCEPRISALGFVAIGQYDPGRC